MASESRSAGGRVVSDSAAQTGKVHLETAGERRKAVTANVSPLPLRPRFNGFSEAQVQQVLEAIATTAKLVRSVADTSQGTDEDLQVISALAERIGMLADLAGAGCVGRPAQWILGVSFGREESSHG